MKRADGTWEVADVREEGAVYAASANDLPTMEELEAEPTVVDVEPIYIWSAYDLNAKSILPYEEVQEPNDPYFQENWQWQLEKTNFVSMIHEMSKYEPSSVTVAVLDSGVDMDHEDLVNVLVDGYDFVSNDNIPEDQNGHGTHVAGIIGAEGNNGLGITGVASGVNIMPLRVLDANGDGKTIHIADAIRYAVDHGADVINMSLGAPTNSEIVVDALNYAFAHDVLVVAAAGNESNHYIDGEPGDYDSTVDTERYAAPIGYPAAIEGVIAVGACDEIEIPELESYRFAVADFSNVGPELDVVAPGVEIVSTTMDGGYGMYSGTSQATPIVSAVLAAMKAKYGESLSPDEYAKYLRATAYDVVTTADESDAGFDENTGHGFVVGENAIFYNKITELFAIASGTERSLVELDPAFYPSDMNYRGIVASDVTEVTIFPAGAQGDVVMRTVNGTSFDEIAEGSNTYTLSPIGEDGVEYDSYTLEIYKQSGNAALSGITLDSVDLSPGFHSDIFTYDVDVLNSMSEVSIFANKAHEHATLMINGETYASGAEAVIILAEGANAVEILVTAEDGTQKTYTINIYRMTTAEDNTLNSLSIDGVDLTPAFEPLVQTYAAAVERSVDQVVLHAVANQGVAKTQINAVDVDPVSGAAIGLDLGVNAVTVTVTSEKNTNRNYTVNITRKHDDDTSIAKMEVVSPASLSLSYTDSSKTYTGQVENTVSEVSVKPVLNSAYATLTLNGQPHESASAAAFSIDVGLNTIPMIVTAENGDLEEYTLAITRASLHTDDDDDTDDSENDNAGGSYIPPSGGGGSTETENKDIVDTDDGQDDVTVIEGENGETVSDVKVSKKRIEKLLESNKTNVKIKVEREEEVDTVQVSLEKDVVDSLVEAGVDVEVQADEVQFIVRPEALEKLAIDGNVQFVSEKGIKDELPAAAPEKNDHLKAVGHILNLDIVSGGKKIKQLEEPVKVTLQYDPEAVGNQYKLGVYYLNEETGEWEYVKSRRIGRGHIQFDAKHFSKYTVMESARTFDDVQDHWAKQYVEMAAAKGITSGVTHNTFAPQKELTRAEFMTMLVNMLGVDQLSEENPFSDLEGGAWYTEYVLKAFEGGLINETSGAIRARDAITREEMASMLVNAYAIATGRSKEEIMLAQMVMFTDEGAASQEHRIDVRRVKGLGLMSGDTSGTFRPKDGATRAEAMTVLIKLLLETEGL